VKLLTVELRRRLPALYSTEKQRNPWVICKFFTPDANWTWFVIEGSPEENGDFRFYGLVAGQFRELGYFTLRQLESIRGPVGLSVERDRLWLPMPLAMVMRSG